ncbi:MAG: M50 family metallopeptidase [Solirubrobacteraceae bacterium]
MSWILTIVGISALVILHEFGHFAAAKAVGMRVERFSLFFGPMLVKVKRGETEYGVGSIPLGGYVKIAGMNPAEPMPEGQEHRGYFRQPVWKRVVVIAAGPAMNILIAFLILFGVYWLSAQHPSSNRAKIVAVQPGRPADGVLRKGDVLLAVDGRPVALKDESFNFIGAIEADRCAGRLTAGCAGARPIAFLVQRGGRRMTVDVTPRYATIKPPGGAPETRMLVGITSGEVLRRDSLGAALGASVSQMWNVTTTTVSKVSQIFTSQQARGQLHGIVGVSDVASQAFSFGIAEAMYVLALLSLSLAIINLFPFLPLDGGHLFWALAEKIRGRAIPFSVMERASVAGIALVLVVAAIGLSNDIHSLSSGGLTLHR